MQANVMSHILSNKASIVIVVAAVVVVVLPLFLPVVKHKEFSFFRSQRSSMATEKFGVKIQKNPPESKLTELGVRTWPKYVALSPSISNIYFPFFTLGFCFIYLNSPVFYYYLNFYLS